jgi:hypothetical protein
MKRMLMETIDGKPIRKPDPLECQILFEARRNEEVLKRLRAGIKENT